PKFPDEPHQKSFADGIKNIVEEGSGLTQFVFFRNANIPGDIKKVTIYENLVTTIRGAKAIFWRALPNRPTRYNRTLPSDPAMVVVSNHLFYVGDTGGLYLEPAGSAVGMLYFVISDGMSLLHDSVRRSSSAINPNL